MSEFCQEHLVHSCRPPASLAWLLASWTRPFLSLDEVIHESQTGVLDPSFGSIAHGIFSSRSLNRLKSAFLNSRVVISSEIVALKLHADLKFRLFVPQTAQSSVQTLQMGTWSCWFPRNRVRAFPIMLSGGCTRLRLGLFCWLRGLSCPYHSSPFVHRFLTWLWMLISLLCHL